MLFEVPEWNLGEPAQVKAPKEKTIAALERPIDPHERRVKFDPSRNVVHPIPKAPRKGPEWQLIQEMNMRRPVQEEVEDGMESERKRKKREKRDEKRRKAILESQREEEDEKPQEEKLEAKPREDKKVTKVTPGEVKKAVKVIPEKVDKHAAKLMGARFRFLNERLYTCASEEALQHFKANPSDFEHYHRGFREQTARWPINPLDVFIDRLRRDAPQKAKVADLGCGEARLARTLRQDRPDLHVLSYDLVAADPELVQVADICNLPLPADSVDFVVVCLALMNTNYWQAIAEAHRILRPGGQLWIAEVESRFHGGLKGMEQFSQVLNDHFGFSPSAPIDTSHRVFCLICFSKKKAKKKMLDLPDLLKPCLYKKR